MFHIEPSAPAVWCTVGSSAVHGARCTLSERRSAALGNSCHQSVIRYHSLTERRLAHSRHSCRANSGHRAEPSRAAAVSDRAGTVPRGATGKNQTKPVFGADKIPIRHCRRKCVCKGGVLVLGICPPDCDWNWNV